MARANGTTVPAKRGNGRLLAQVVASTQRASPAGQGIVAAASTRPAKVARTAGGAGSVSICPCLPLPAPVRPPHLLRPSDESRTLGPLVLHLMRHPVGNFWYV